MNAGRVFAVAGRLARQLRRDPRALALILFAPLLIMTLLAALLKTETEMPTIAIHAVGPASLFTADLERELESPEDPDDAFRVVQLDDGQDPRDAVVSGFTDAVIVFPDRFLEDRASGKRSNLDLLVEGADPMRTTDVFSRFRKALPDSMSGLPVFLPPECDAECADTIPDGPPDVDLVKVFGESIEEEMDFFTPVLPPFFAFFFVFILSGLTFLRERVDGTAERVLASPLHRGELVLGYVLGFLPAALLQATVVILFARFALGGPLGGWPVVLTVLLLTLVAECVGVFVSAFARSEFQVFQFIPVIILPQLLLCGIIWPVKTMPLVLKIAAYAFPLTYAVEAIRDVAIRGLGFGAVWHDLAALLGYAAAGLVLAAYSVRRVV